MTKLTLMIVTVGMAALTGCQKESAPSAPAPNATPPPSGSINVTAPAPAAPDASAAQPPSTPGAAPAAPADAANANPSPEGLPMTDDSGKVLDTLGGLQRAVEYYTRVLVPRVPVDEEEEKRFKPVPPLKDLQQLVEYKVIRAVPAAPAGKKYVYDPISGKVKLENQ
jgi:hypothetical protein